MLSFCLSLIDNSVCQGVSDIYICQGLEILILTHCFPSGWGWNCLVNDSFLLRCVRKIAKTDCWLCRDHLCVHPSVHVEQLGSHWMDFYEIWSLSIFLNICGKFSSFIKTWPRIMGTLHEAICTFIIISHQILLRKRNNTDKSWRENQNTYFINDFFPINHAVHESLWKKMVQSDSPQMTI